MLDLFRCWWIEYKHGNILWNHESLCFSTSFCKGCCVLYTMKGLWGFNLATSAFSVESETNYCYFSHRDHEFKTSVKGANEKQRKKSVQWNWTNLIILSYQKQIYIRNIIKKWINKT